MFGYVVADLEKLSDENKERYRSCYCGLCRKIGSKYGTIHRMTLNYDLTFLTLLLSSLYEPDEITKTERCLVHPLSARAYWQTEITDYTAAMTIALSYYKAKDDWHDDKTLTSLLVMSVLQKEAAEIENQYPHKWNAICTNLKMLSDLEASNCQEPDRCANLFGSLMGELFVWKQDRWEPILRRMGAALGRYIYLMDALLDLPADLQKNRYNPFSSRPSPKQATDNYLPVLNMMMGECCAEFEKLPVLQDLDILRNILYSGVWSRYHNQKFKEQNHD